jgi:hypothetical protein
VISIDSMRSPGSRSRCGSRSRIERTTSIPSVTRPNTLCRSSRCGVGPNVMKNWLPFVPAPAFAIDSIPGPECRSVGWNSSLNW